jgi:hypothetical protein
LYRAGFERVGDVMRYGCSCPFFSDRGERCKHLCALVFQASSSALVASAAACKFFVADRTILDVHDADGQSGADRSRGTQSGTDAQAEPPLVQGGDIARPELRSRSSAWRELADEVARRQSLRRTKLELLYFLSLGRRPHGGAVTIGQRRVGAPAAAFALAARLEPESLEHEQDRELFGLLMGHRALAESYYASGGRAVAPLSPFIAPTILEKLAATGRCHVVPEGLTDLEHEWHAFANGRHATQRAQQRNGLDFARLLAWPLMEKDTGPEYRLELELRVSRMYRSSTDRLFDIEATLFRGSERHAASGVSYVHPASGSLVIGHRLAHSTPPEAAWLSTLSTRGSLGQVAEAELAELMEAASGPRGVCVFKLPADYERVPRTAPPEPQLSLNAPRAHKLRARLSFDYAGELVPAEKRSLLVIAGRSVWQRDQEAERAALTQLRELGFRGKLLRGEPLTKDDAGITIDEGLVPAAIRGLLHLGWQVEAEGRRYRTATSFDVKVETGVDWFEVKGDVRFGAAELAFPRLLAAIKKQRPFVELGDGSFGVLPEDWLQRWGVFAELSSERGEDLRISTQQIGLMQGIASRCAGAGYRRTWPRRAAAQGAQLRKRECGAGA